VLPYPSYLRVYEPLEALDAELQDRLAKGSFRPADPEVAVGAEQQGVMTRVAGSLALLVDDSVFPCAYVVKRHGRTFVCPVDMPLRSWLSLSSLVEAVGDANMGLLIPPQSVASADEAFLHWRRDHPTAVPHIRQTAWGIPRTWFVLVVEDERETYAGDRIRSVRYRASVADAQRRLTAAHAVLGKLIDDSELLEELADLSQWLAAFDDDSVVELDYAGVAQLMGAKIDDDSSARDVHRAIRSLRRRDFADAAAAYRAFEERWRAVNAFERAN
jgi:hypothetical protein